MGKCLGNSEDHCCWVNSTPCRFLEENTVPDRRWACGLRRRLGSWEAVHNDPGYLEHIKPNWEAKNVADCGDWPIIGEVCAICGATG